MLLFLFDGLLFVGLLPGVFVVGCVRDCVCVVRGGGAIVVVVVVVVVGVVGWLVVVGCSLFVVRCLFLCVFVCLLFACLFVCLFVGLSVVVVGGGVVGGGVVCV